MTFNHSASTLGEAVGVPAENVEGAIKFALHATTSTAGWTKVVFDHFSKMDTITLAAIAFYSSEMLLNQQPQLELLLKFFSLASTFNKKHLPTKPSETIEFLSTLPKEVLIAWICATCAMYVKRLPQKE